MDYRKAIASLALACLATMPAAGAVTIEIAAEAGPQATAQRGWLQLLAELGAGNTRVRQAARGERPRIDELGTEARPLPRLVAVLGRDNVLRVPGARFRLRDREKLGAYLERLAGEGKRGITAARGKFDLTEAQFTELFDHLKAPIGPIDPGADLRTIVASLENRLPPAIEVDPRAAAALGAHPEGTEKLKGLAIGTALAAMLRQEGLLLTAERPAGGKTRLRVVTTGKEIEAWPVGYKPEGSPRTAAPALFEWVNAEIDGFSLAQAIEAIEPRLQQPGRPLPVVWDHFALRRDAIDPAQKPVKHAPKRTFYKKVLDRLAFQARLKAELRVDESGAPFVWLSR